MIFKSHSLNFNKPKYISVEFNLGFISQFSQFRREFINKGKVPKRNLHIKP